MPDSLTPHDFPTVDEGLTLYPKADVAALVRIAKRASDAVVAHLYENVPYSYGYNLPATYSHWRWGDGRSNRGPDGAFPDDARPAAQVFGHDGLPLEIITDEAG